MSTIEDMIERFRKSREALLARETTETLSHDDRRELAALDAWFHEDDDAIQRWDSLLKVAPDDKEVMLHLFAGIMMNAAYWHRLPELHDLANRIIEPQDEWSAAGYNRLAWIKHTAADHESRSGDLSDSHWEEQIVLRRQAVALAPEWVYPRTGLSHACKMCGRYDEALDEMREALEYVLPWQESSTAHRAYLDELVIGRMVGDSNLREMHNEIAELENLVKVSGSQSASEDDLPGEYDPPPT